MRRLRFSIRTLMIVTLLVAVLAFVIPDLAKRFIESQLRRGDYSSLEFTQNECDSVPSARIITTTTTLLDYLTFHRVIAVQVDIHDRNEQILLLTPSQHPPLQPEAVFDQPISVKIGNGSNYGELHFKEEINIRFCWVTHQRRDALNRLKAIIEAFGKVQTESADNRNAVDRGR